MSYRQPVVGLETGASTTADDKGTSSGTVDFMYDRFVYDHQSLGGAT